MNQDAYGLSSLIATDGVAVGDTPVNVTTGIPRAVVRIVALDQDVFIKYTMSSTAPTISDTDFHEMVSAGDFTPFNGLSEKIYVWVWSAVAGTVNVIEGAY